MYQVRLARDAEKELNRLSSTIVKRIFPAIKSLAENPRPRGCKKLKGLDEDLWRIRVGDYRVVYVIEDSIKIVEVKKIGHRKEIYD